LTKSDNVLNSSTICSGAPRTNGSTLTRILGSANLDLAEDVVQDALLKSPRAMDLRGVRKTPRPGSSRSPRTAPLDLLGAIHPSLRNATRFLAAFPTETPARFEAVYPFRDDQLAMMFPLLPSGNRSGSARALTLKTVGGFNVREIARAFLAEESAIAQRIVRAKRQIRDQKLDMASPSDRPSSTASIPSSACCT